MNTPSEKTVTSSSNSKVEAIIISQQLKMQFHGTRKGDVETIDSYIKKLKSTADSLAAIGNPISDSDLVLQLLAGLPHSQYLLLKNTILSRFPLPNFSEACSMLYESTGENSNSNTCKSTLEMIHDIANTVTTVVPIAHDFCNVIRRWSGSGSSGTPIKATPGNNTGNTNKGSSGGRGRGNNTGNTNKESSGGRGRGNNTGNTNKGSTGGRGRGNNTGNTNKGSTGGRGRGNNTGNTNEGSTGGRGRGNNNRGRGGCSSRNSAGK